MPDTLTGTAKDAREDFDKVAKRVNDLDATVNDKTQGLAQRISSLEERVAELERRK
jgi:TolA-binding protein